MNEMDERSALAADRLLRTQIERVNVKLVELEIAAWLVGNAGREPVHLGSLAEDLHVQLAFLFGAQQLDAAEALLRANLATTEGDTLLVSACYFAGAITPDRLIEIAHSHPGKWFSGQMLASTSKPERLLALFDNQPLLGNSISTTGELVIRGRDARSAIAVAEARWATLVANPDSHGHELQFRDTWLRISARESLEEAAELLLDLGDYWGHDALLDGVRAVLCRLVRQDPERAASLVMSSDDPWDQLAWFEPLAWWFNLPKPAEQILRNLLNRKDPEIDVGLARILTRARSREWLAQALVSAREQPSLSLARDLAPGVYQLRKAGLYDEAERVRDMVLPLLPDRSNKGDEVSPRDLFDALSAATLPPLVPWGAGPGLT